MRMETKQLKQIQKKIGIKFHNDSLLANAFIHRSYLNENKLVDLPSNERLEFLGDACLELAASEFLYSQYPDEPEGVLTNYRSALVNTVSLAESSRQLDLGKYLLLSRGEDAGGGRNSDYLLANTFEALLGAIYIDQGYTQVVEIVRKYVLSKLDAIIEQQSHRDPKSKLQEFTQAEYSMTPEYEILSDWGPDHDKTFRVAVKVGDKTIGIGTGTSKQRAELEAANVALEKLTPSQVPVDTE